MLITDWDWPEGQLQAPGRCGLGFVETGAC
jgi:hypothetical protein